MPDALARFLHETAVEPFDVRRNLCGIWVLRWRAPDIELPVFETWDDVRKVDAAAMFRDYAHQLGLRRKQVAQRGDVALFRSDARFRSVTGWAMGIFTGEADFWAFRAIKGVRVIRWEGGEIWG